MPKTNKKIINIAPKAEHDSVYIFHNILFNFDVFINARGADDAMKKFDQCEFGKELIGELWLNYQNNRRRDLMAHKLDCTEKAYEIMMKHTTWRKPKRMTPKRQKAIDASWPRWKIYRDALKKAGLYGGMAWSAESKYPKIDIDTKEKFTESMLTQHCISHTFLLDIERIT